MLAYESVFCMYECAVEGFIRYLETPDGSREGGVMNK